MLHKTIGFLVGSLLLSACVADAEDHQCPSGTVKMANKCAPIADLAAPEPGRRLSQIDAGFIDGGLGEDAGGTTGPGNAVPIPFWVDAHFAMSGFFPGPPGVMEIQESCPGFAGTDPSSVCRKITFRPNGGTFGGFYFQNEPNNWGTQEGTSIAPGAQKIVFRAWAETAGVQASFGAGIDNDEAFSDGWHVEQMVGTLPMAPMDYQLDISNTGYSKVVGGFLWVVSTPDGSTPVTIYIDNIRWE